MEAGPQHSPSPQRTSGHDAASPAVEGGATRGRGRDGRQRSRNRGGQRTAGHGSQQQHWGQSSDQPPGLNGTDQGEAGQPFPASYGQGQVSGPVRKEQGFVVTIREGYGFISGVERQDQVFFHVSGVVTASPQEGQGEGGRRDLSALLAPGDEVEFVVPQALRPGAKVVAQQVVKLPRGTVQRQLLSEQRYSGTVEREVRRSARPKQDGFRGRINCQAAVGTQEGEAAAPPPQQSLLCEPSGLAEGVAALRVGDAVEFNIATDRSTKQRSAVQVVVTAPAASPEDSEPRETGVVAALKDRYGFIECSEREARLFFHFSEVPRDTQPLALGQRVAFTVTQAQGKEVAARLQVLPAEELPTERVQGTVDRMPKGGETPEDGVVSYLDDCGVLHRCTFAVDQAPAGAELAEGDEVECDVACTSQPGAKGRAAAACQAQGLRLLRRGADRRELGQVAVLRNNFGFIRGCLRPGQIFFHFDSLEGWSPNDLAVGTDVEFTRGVDSESGKVAATRVTRAAPGSAVFETVSEAQFSGVVLERATANKGYATGGSGVLQYADPADGEGGPLRKLPFGVADLASDLADSPPRVGDRVTFNVATQPAAASAAQRGAGAAAESSTSGGGVGGGDSSSDLRASLTNARFKLAGRRATNVALMVMEGTVTTVKPHFGFLQFSTVQTQRDWKAVKEERAAAAAAVSTPAEPTAPAEAMPAGASAAGDSTAGEAAGSSSASQPEQQQQAPDGGEAEQPTSSAVPGDQQQQQEGQQEAQQQPGKQKKGKKGKEAAPAAYAWGLGSTAQQSAMWRVNEVEGGVTLRTGDVVEFVLTENPRTREKGARRLRRTREAPPERERKKDEPLVAERNPNAPKFQGGAAQGSKGNQTVRMARMPDGTRGFAAGRGRGLPPPPPGSAPTVAPAPGAPADGTSVAPAPAPLQGLIKSASGRLLNPSARAFVPRPASGTALDVAGSAGSGGSLEEGGAP